MRCGGNGLGYGFCHQCSGWHQYHKQKELDIYNETATERMALSEETEVRYALAVCYLALIEEVEKYVRYEPDEPNYIRNTNDAREMYDMAFSLL